MNDEDKRFGEEFFDAHKEEPGVYKTYRVEDLYPQFMMLATWVKNAFSPERILDVGCAKGFLVKILKDLGMEAYGVDVSEYAISGAPTDIRSNMHKVDLNKDILPFEDEYFEFVTCLGTIEYLSDYKHALREIKRVLTPGGLLYLTTIYTTDPRDKIRINVHDKDYWVREFQSEGFRFVPKDLAAFLKIYDSYRIERRSQALTGNLQKNTFAFRIGKLIYQRGGYIGKKIGFICI